MHVIYIYSGGDLLFIHEHQGVIITSFFFFLRYYKLKSDIIACLEIEGRDLDNQCEVNY